MNLEQEVFEIGKQLEKIVDEKGTAVSHIHLLLLLYECPMNKNRSCYDPLRNLETC